MASVESRIITYRIHKAVFLLDKIADKVLQQKLGLTFSQFRVMMAINHRKVSQKNIADFWDMTEAAVSRQVDILKQKKLIIKHENRKNRRAYILNLTDFGQKQLQKAFDLVGKEFEKVLKVISQRERQSMAASLDKLLKILCKNYVAFNG